MTELFVAGLVMAGIVAAANSVSWGIDAAVHPEKPVEHIQESEGSVVVSLLYGLAALVLAAVLL